MKITKESAVDEAKMLEEIRQMLGLNIEQFVSQMDWPNAKYYNYIKNGRRRPENNEKIKTHPTIFKIFTGINYALTHYDNWREKSSDITAIVISYLLPRA